MTVVAYVSNADSGDISVLRLGADGTLDAVQTRPAGGTVMPLAVGPGRHHLYAALRSEPWSVACFDIDTATGELAPLATVPLPADTAYLSTDRTGRYLFGASYTGNIVSVNAIGPDGVVAPDPVAVLPTPPHAHSIVVAPDNRHLFAAVLGGDAVLQFRFDPQTGVLTPNDPAFVSTLPGAGPRHLVFHPGGRFVYVADELDGTVGGYEFDSGTGQLVPLDTISVLPDGVSQPWTAELRLTPDGRLLYVSDRTSSTLAGFRVDATTGALKLLGHTETEACPRGFDIDPGGRFLLAAGQQSDALTVHAIDADSGALRPLGRYPVGRNPNWVQIVELPSVPEPG
ncbi:lactonase family protein [Nocardia aurantia]|uniref:6-phosphogluconolactonase n=1 Tax=Nocardia aurantia TaxID=2585199 RepID=A0A7K0DVJ0_9NOCA|nr:beta-propeller fold lactonase family protein [Nocardia aurantia]MQY29779.1 6-phosphogluconolactonase [Nocardia aurantia]